MGDRVTTTANDAARRGMARCCLGGAAPPSFALRFVLFDFGSSRVLSRSWSMTLFSRARAWRVRPRRCRKVSAAADAPPSPIRPPPTASAEGIVDVSAHK